MLLGEMKDVVTKFAEVISKVLDVDVLIVDSNLKTVGNTYRYFDKYTLIRRISVIGQVITSGKVVAIDDKTNHNACKECPDYNECEMSAFVGVPIWYNDSVMGAISLVLPKSRIHQIFKDVRYSVEFLERMADLLSSKIQNSDDYNKLNIIKREREVMMDSIDDAVVSMDQIGYITYYNKRFEQYFGLEESCVGKFIKDIIPHKLIDDFLSNYTEFSDRLIYLKQPRYPFYGFLSCRNITINENITGLLFAFKSIGALKSVLTEIVYNNKQTSFAWASNGMMESHVMAQAKRASVTNNIILICGAAGMGKEMLAKAIHGFSGRSNNCFITVNCNEGTRDLLEKSIFGDNGLHQVLEGIGKLQLAHQGTIYFSNIDALPFYLQQRMAQFLRTHVLYENGIKEVQPDIRLIASTSQNLSQLVEQSYFDEELYYRLSQEVISIPSLKNDKDSVKLLISSGVAFYKEKYQKPNLFFGEDVISVLEEHSWNGNKKELERVLDYLVHTCKEQVTMQNLAKIHLIQQKEPLTIQELERESISALLLSNKNRDEVAQMLGISRATLYRKIKTYQL